MNFSQLGFLAAAKAWIALIGTAATALEGVFAADTTFGKILMVVTTIGTAVGTWSVPNAKTLPTPVGPAVPPAAPPSAPAGP